MEHAIQRNTRMQVTRFSIYYVVSNPKVLLYVYVG